MMGLIVIMGLFFVACVLSAFFDTVDMKFTNRKGGK